MMWKWVEVWLLNNKASYKTMATNLTSFLKTQQETQCEIECIGICICICLEKIVERYTGNCD